ncbi:ribbon-helix-helix protein, CopG family [Streptomyces sp. LP05-1]|uniref:Ribbon-helix-helix protein, CopG family n=1 Tax=Streptomyces pyxinae TaxID=2970734 RepID=A0ABT2CA82_9ACTN|nr:ribbon-helix-helix protein, CopG family [Streptomyces sp. LP05-1]MCS0634308.1 ribbon-helix-helix protein, CopG family [Streptomyces sp. LP05-1]
MGLRRIDVYVDQADLELIRAAAIRRGLPEAELVREAVHRLALATRVWDEAFIEDEDTFDFGGPVGPEEIRATRARPGPVTGGRSAAAP